MYHLAEDFDYEESYASVGTGVIWEISIPSQFCYKSYMLLKNKVFIYKKRGKEK